MGLPPRNKNLNSISFHLRFCIWLDHLCCLEEAEAVGNMVGYVEQLERRELSLSLSQPDPVVLELNRLQNLLKEKEREVGVAHSEIKALRATEAQKDKAVEELRMEVDKLDDKLRFTENLLHHKNLEVKKLSKDKKDAVAAQYAAEATLRRVHASQKDDDAPSMESVIAPLEATIKMFKNEIASLQEDKKALERLTKSKEAALLEAERILRSALERALIVEEVQNQNFELKRQIEICQEENRILEKTNRQKVLEIEKLFQTINELEEVILAGGAAANAIRDYQRQLERLNEEKRTLERELARARVSANRVAAVVANEWKDENDRVMPIKQWLEERKLLQAEMQRLREKLSITERTAKAEAQLKEKLKVRLKTLEDGLKQVSSFPMNPSAFCRSPKTEKSNNILGFLTSNGGLKKRSTSQPRASAASRSSTLQQPEEKGAAVELKNSNSPKKKHGSGENVLKRGIWASRSRVVDSGEKVDVENKLNTVNNGDDVVVQETENQAKTKSGGNVDDEDTVSGFLYDRLQKEVIHLRKLRGVKDEEIKMLEKKVDALNKAVEVESKKMKREAATSTRRVQLKQ